MRTVLSLACLEHVLPQAIVRHTQDMIKTQLGHAQDKAPRQRLSCMLQDMAGETFARHFQDMFKACRRQMEHSKYRLSHVFTEIVLRVSLVMRRQGGRRHAQDSHACLAHVLQQCKTLL